MLNPPKKKSFFLPIFSCLSKRPSSPLPPLLVADHTPDPKQGLPLPTNKIFLSDLPKFLKIYRAGSPEKSHQRTAPEKSSKEQKSKPSHFWGFQNGENFRCSSTVTHFLGSHPMAWAPPWKPIERLPGHFSPQQSPQSCPPMRSHINLAELPIGIISQFVAFF